MFKFPDSWSLALELQDSRLVHSSYIRTMNTGLPSPFTASLNWTATAQAGVGSRSVRRPTSITRRRDLTMASAVIG